jgi:hypothetical protein
MRRFPKALSVNEIKLEMVREKGGNAAQRGKTVSHCATTKEEPAFMATPF